MNDHTGLIINNPDFFAIFRTFEISFGRTISIHNTYINHGSDILCIINPEPIEEIPDISNRWTAEKDETSKLIVHSPDCFQITVDSSGLYDGIISGAFKKFRDLRIILSKPSGDKSKTKSEIENKQKQIRDRIYNQILGNVDSEKVSVMANIKVLESELKSCQAHIITISKRLEQGYKRIEELESLPEGEEKEMMIDNAVEGVMKLYKSGAYANIEFTMSSIKALTPGIWIELNNKFYYMGTYVIQIPYNDTGVRILSVEKPPGYSESYPHPHVNTSGGPCLGNISRAVSQYLKKGRYGALLSLLKEYLESCNPGDTYLDISSWPSYDKKSDLNLSNSEN